MSHPDLPFGYPNHPGYVPTETSLAAADQIAKVAPGMAALVLACIKEQPRNCWEVEQVLGMAHQTASARIRELVMRGKVEGTTLKRPMSSGRLGTVWVACG